MALVATEPLKRRLKGDETAGNFAEALECVTGVLELTADARLAFAVHTGNPMAAAQIKTKLDELMQVLAFVSAGKDANAQIAKEVLDNIKVNTDKSDVNIGLTLTDAQLEKVRKKEP